MAERALWWNTSADSGCCLHQGLVISLRLRANTDDFFWIVGCSRLGWLGILYGFRLGSHFLPKSKLDLNIAELLA